MSRFSVLQQKFNELKAAEEAYWLDLQEAVEEIVSGFGSYLKIPEQVQDSLGLPAKWLYLGTVAESQFSECAVSKLPRREDLLCFTIGLALSAEFSEKPKSFHSVSLMIRKVGDSYQITSVGSVIPQITIKNRDFGELFSALDRRVETLLDQGQ